MPRQGLRLCTCERCGASGQVVTAVVHRQHQQRQRRRLDRAAHTSLLASLASHPDGVAPEIPSGSLAEHSGPTSQHGSGSARPTPAVTVQPHQRDRGRQGDHSATTPAVAGGEDSAVQLEDPQASFDLADEGPRSPQLDEGVRCFDPTAFPPPGAGTSHAAALDDSVGNDGTFDEAFFAEDNDQRSIADEEAPDAGDAEDEVEVVDEADTYSSSTAHEQRITAGLIDLMDFPHAMGESVSLPQWQRLTYLFVLCMSSRHHLSDQAASTLLRFTDEVLIPALVATDTIGDVAFPSLKVTLPAVKKALGVEPALVRYVVCPRCTDLYPWSLKDALKVCASCGADLHQPAAFTPSLGRIGSTRPQVFYTVSPIRTWLEALIQRPEVEDALDKAFGAHARPSTDASGARVFCDISDGDQWRLDLDSCGVPFVNDPLSLHLTIGVDWFLPFKINNASWHSSGAITMMVNNLSDALRHCSVHLAAVMPGPQETSDEALGKYLAPIVEELKVLNRGVWVVTPRSSQPRLLRAWVLLFCGDTPARAKTCGFPGHRANSFCTTCFASKLRRHLPLKEFARRDPEQHRAGAIAARQEQANPVISRTAREENIRQRGARWSQLYELPYWRSVTSAPPDAMHAVFLGVVKRFWHRFFVDAIVSLDAGLLARPQACIAGYKGPLAMKKPDRRLGDRGGGNPNADQWCCLARNLLVFQFADLFDDALCRPFADSEDDYIRAKFPKASASDGPIKRPYVEEGMRAGHSDVVKVVENLASAISKPTAPVGRTGTAVPVDPIATAAQPAATSDSLDVLLAKRDVFLLAMHVAAVAELAYASEVSEADVKDLEAVVEGHLLLSALISPLWPTVNTHYVLHLPEFIRRFGPCRAWWAFTFERINGWLSEAAGCRSNRKRDGQVEYSMMRAFWDRTAMQTIIQGQAARDGPVAESDGIEKALWKLVGKRKGARSTIDAQSDERLYRSHPQFDHIVLEGPGREGVLSVETMQSLVAYLNAQGSGTSYQPLWSFQPGTRTVEIRDKVTLFGSFSLRGQRFVALNFRSNAHKGSSFAVARRDGLDTPCQIINIFEHRHISTTGDDVTCKFLEVRWLDPIPWPEHHPMRRHAVITKHLRCSLAAQPTTETTSMIRACEIVCQAAVTPCTVNGIATLGIKQLYE